MKTKKPYFIRLFIVFYFFENLDKNDFFALFYWALTTLASILQYHFILINKNTLKNLAQY